MNSNQNLADALYNAVRNVHGQAMADAMRANPSTGYGPDVDEPDFRVDTDSTSGRS